jgi:hypothetical protein
MVELPGIILMTARPRRGLAVSWGLGKVVHKQNEGAGIRTNGKNYHMHRSLIAQICQLKGCVVEYT